MPKFAFKFAGLGVILLVTFQQCGPVPMESHDEASILRADAGDSEEVQSAATTLVQRLSHATAINDPLMLKVKELISVGRPREAALEITKSDGFYNTVVRDMATKMSNREQSMAGVLNDFVATFIGIARDDLDARLLLTGDFFYWAPNVTSVPRDIRADVVMSNKHYEALDSTHVNLAKNLVRQNGIQVAGPTGANETLSDPAGVITSRAFMMAHASAGTNRRLVEYSMMQFLCAPIAEWANTSTADVFVGRDIGRDPSEVYKSKCVGCHAPMDAMRPAFAHVDYVFTATTGYTQYMKVTAADPADSGSGTVAVPAAEQKVPSKFRRAKSVFPNGYAVQDDQWENLTSDRYGWRTPMQGRGMNGFGKMLGDSKAFSRCMAQRVFETVCYQSVAREHEHFLQSVADEFENQRYSLRNLFADVATRPECLKGFGP